MWEEPGAKTEIVLLRHFLSIPKFSAPPIETSHGISSLLFHKSPNVFQKFMLRFHNQNRLCNKVYITCYDMFMTILLSILQMSCWVNPPVLLQLLMRNTICCIEYVWLRKAEISGAMVLGNIHQMHYIMSDTQYLMFSQLAMIYDLCL